MILRLPEGAFPAITRALNLVREDNGGPSWPAEARPSIPVRWYPHLPEVEAALASLADDRPAWEDHETRAFVEENGFSYIDSELYAFCNGEEGVMRAIQGRSEGLALAGRFLNDFFEGWDRYESDGL